MILDAMLLSQPSTFWVVDIGRGQCTLKLPVGLHPEEAEEALMDLYGEAGRLADPTEDDKSPGNPQQVLPENLSVLNALQYHDFTGQGPPVLRHLGGPPSTGSHTDIFRQTISPRQDPNT